MKRIIPVIAILTFLISNLSYSQFIPEVKSLNQISKMEKSTFEEYKKKKQRIPGVGISLGMSIINDAVGYAIGGFAEFGTKGIAFVPQFNYWNQDTLNNFEFDGLVRNYFTNSNVKPFVDGGLGVNFFNTTDVNIVKLSVILGAGVKFGNIANSFDLILDGKYKLIINDSYDFGNISCFIFTAGFKFPMY